ncbi:hypothetical protein ABEDC_0941 [Acinetobacter lwoffii]|nr:hypothetical protein ABEDC_0941 [Acinetobacter lwoffii]
MTACFSSTATIDPSCFKSTIYPSHSKHFQIITKEKAN